MACTYQFGNDAAAKANEFAIEGLKQLVTLATGSLVLTITFLKDILGNSVSKATALCLVPMSWLLLLVAIYLGWVAIADAARRLGTGKVTGYAFAPGLKPRTLARAAQLLFCFGLLLLTLFMTLNFHVMLLDKAEKPATKQKE